MSVNVNRVMKVSMECYNSISRDLAYVIGVLWKGDGTVCISKSKEKYRGELRTRYYFYIQLKVRSRRFAERFNIAMARALCRRL